MVDKATGQFFSTHDVQETQPKTLEKMWDKPPPGQNPPLRERNGDLIPLTEDFVYQVPSRAQRLDRCEGYGNLRPPGLPPIVLCAMCRTNC